jgi:hypothetical protein
MAEKKITAAEQLALDSLSGDKLKYFLEFYGFLAENKVSRTKTTPYNVTLKYKTIRFATITFRKNEAVNSDYHISYYNDFVRKEWFECGEKYMTDGLKEYILTKINTYPGCGNCKGTSNAVILGKRFDTVCTCHPLVLHDLNGEKIEYAKEIVLAAKNIINESK